MRFDCITLFPSQLAASVSYGVVGRAFERGQAQLACYSPRDFAGNRHGHVDDRPFGGGPGMVMRPEPLAAALQAAQSGHDKPATVIYLSPQGRTLDQSAVEHLAQQSRLILLCGRYEGIDERFIQRHVDEQWSIGDYVLSGGEPAATVLIDSIVRLLPGVLGHDQSAQQDSFTDNLLDCPHYTRPEVWDGEATPSVLLGGNHAEIARWRRQQALQRTAQLRPDLLNQAELSDEDRRLLDRK